MKLTTLFRLRKPDGTDPVNIEDFNDNFDVIDEELGKRLESTGAASDMTVAFTQASSRANLSTGEKISESFGKIMKWFADLKAVAFSGSYNDLTSKPTIPSGAAASQAVANNCTTTAAGSVLDARQGKILNDKYNQLNSEMNDYKLSDYESVNVMGNALNIAYTERFLNINFLGLSLSSPLDAYSYREIVSNFDAFTTYNLDYITVPLVVLNTHDVPIGTAIAIVWSGSIVVVANVNISTTDKLYGSTTKWYSDD